MYRDPQERSATPQAQQEVDGDLASLRRLCDGAQVFIDTSSLLVPGAGPALLDELLPALKANRQPLHVLARTVDHLQRLSRGSDAAAAASARTALQLLARLQQSGSVVELADPFVVEAQEDTHRIFATMFIRLQNAARMVLITQDRLLATAVHDNARLKAIERAIPSSALYLGEEGLADWSSRLLEHEAESPVTAPAKDVSLDRLLSQSTRFVVDTSSLMLDLRRSREFFTSHLLPRMQALGLQLIVPERVLRELGHHVDSSDRGLVTKAKGGQEILAAFEAQGLLLRGEDQGEVRGGGKRFADPVFLQLLLRFQHDFPLCFITQDSGLAQALRANRAVDAPNPARVMRLTAGGAIALETWEAKLVREQRRAPQPQRKEGAAGTGRVPKNAQPAPSPANALAATAGPLPFVRAEQPTPRDDTPLVPVQPPVAGAALVGRRSGRFTLGAELASGGEGRIHATDRADVVCKLYHPEQRTRGRLAKLELMTSREIVDAALCWPADIVQTPEGGFVGYLMPRAQGVTLGAGVFGKPRLARQFPQWSRQQLVELADTIVGAIERLHRLNVCIGDINPQNILVRGPRKITLVDLDSVQVEGYPCPVGTDTYTPPQRLGQSYADFLRTQADELFAVTTLVFQILMPGKAPYAAQGGGDVIENMQARRFPYGRQADGKAPRGAWQFIWSHLHPALKDDFIRVFQQDERVELAALRRHLAQYREEIGAGRRSAELFPEAPCMTPGETVRVTCDNCPPDKAEHDITRHAHEQLQLKGWRFRCAACNSLQALQRVQNTRDVDCALHISPQCSGRSAVPISHLENLDASGRDYWCRACAAQQREQRVQRQGGSGGRTHGRGGQQACYVATATYGGVHQPQVAFLRAWRDQVLARSAAGRAFINLYYTVGPALAWPVARMPALQAASRRQLDRLVSRLAAQHPLLAASTGVPSDDPRQP